MQRTRQSIWQPDAALGVPVYGCAAVLFPLHLGWTGNSWAGFAAYLCIATLLFCAVDAFARPRLNRLSLFSESLLVLLAIGLPATLAFAAGSLAGPIDEALDEEVCRSNGAIEEDTLKAESNDTFDVTPDCRATRWR